MFFFTNSTSFKQVLTSLAEVRDFYWLHFTFRDPFVWFMLSWMWNLHVSLYKLRSCNI